MAWGLASVEWQGTEINIAATGIWRRAANFDGRERRKDKKSTITLGAHMLKTGGRAEGWQRYQASGRGVRRRRPIPTPASLQQKAG